MLGTYHRRSAVNPPPRAARALEAFDHLQDIDETGTEVANGTNSQIRDDARTELPMLRMHLRMSRAALAASSK
jgi:hypothetical protein